jgi:hypothetical protein
VQASLQPAEQAANHVARLLTSAHFCEGGDVKHSDNDTRKILRLETMLTSDEDRTRLSDEEIEYMNTLNASDVLALLNRLSLSGSDYVKGLCLDAITNLRGIDRVSSITSLLNVSDDENWRYAYLSSICQFIDDRVIDILRYRLLNDESVYVRILCAELIGELGDYRDIEILSKVSVMDHDSNFEGVMVSEECEKSIRMIKFGSSHRLRLVDWVSQEPKITLISLCEKISLLSDNLTIFISDSSKWSCQSIVMTIPKSNHDEIIMARFGMKYFLELSLAKKIAASKKLSNVTTEDICHEILGFAMSDSYIVE